MSVWLVCWLEVSVLIFLCCLSSGSSPCGELICQRCKTELDIQSEDHRCDVLLLVYMFTVPITVMISSGFDGTKADFEANELVQPRTRAETKCQSGLPKSKCYSQIKAILMSRRTKSTQKFVKWKANGMQP